MMTSALIQAKIKDNSQLALYKRILALKDSSPLQGLPKISVESNQFKFSFLKEESKERQRDDKKQSARLNPGPNKKTSFLPKSFVGTFRNETVRSYRSLTNWASCAMGEATEKTQGLINHYNMIKLELEKKASIELAKPVLDEMAAETGSDLANLMAKKQMELAKHWGKEANVWRKIAKVSKKSLFGMDIALKAWDVTKAAPKERMKVTAIKSLELAGETIGAFVAERLMTRTALAAFKHSFFASATVMIGAATIGSYLARKTAAEAEDWYRSNKVSQK